MRLLRCLIFVATSWVGDCVEPWEKDLQDHSKFKALADHGNAGAMQLVADNYWYGIEGLKKDEAIGLAWYTRAAEAGDADAQLVLAKLLLEGHATIDGRKGSALTYLPRLVDKDLKRSLVWAGKAAKQGLVRAMCFVAQMHTSGNGLDYMEPRNRHKIAAHWWQKAADGGSLLATVTLADSYRKGLGVNKDAHRAAEWYEKALQESASDDGKHGESPEQRRYQMSRAARNLGLMYGKGMLTEGKNTEKGAAKAMAYMARAAELGSTHAKEDHEALLNRVEKEASSQKRKADL